MTLTSLIPLSVFLIMDMERDIKLTRYMAGKLMRRMGLKTCQLKTHKYKHGDEAHKIHGNLSNRNFSPTVPSQVWTGDVTYIRIKGGCCCYPTVETVLVMQDIAIAEYQRAVMRILQ